jgi:fumarate hydratase class II
MAGNDGKTRSESDSFGSILVPADRYWGAQTQRALEHFRIGTETLPRPLIRALGIVKRCAALANVSVGAFDDQTGRAIAAAADKVIGGGLDENFPLHVWQSGSGTQSNMNANEVIANLAIEATGGILGSKQPFHPNDHVNRGQSTNDVFPTAMHIAAVEQAHTLLKPALRRLRDALAEKAEAWDAIVKVGRTHMQDAVPMTLGQEFSGYAAQMALGLDRLADGLKRLYSLAQGGTAIGTGLNAKHGFAEAFIREVVEFTGLPFVSAPNKFEALAAHDALVEITGALNTIAASMNKIAGDIRILGSGPRCGIGELRLPGNEPGSSIMPGKVNPTQCEVVTMVCAQVMGNHVTVTIAGAQGQLELNVFKPVIAHNVLQSIRLLGDAAASLADHCVSGLEPDLERISNFMDRSLMPATALTPRFGYDRIAALVKAALQNGSTIRQETLAAGLMTAEEFDRTVRPEDIVSPD